MPYPELPSLIPPALADQVSRDSVQPWPGVTVTGVIVPPAPESHQERLSHEIIRDLAPGAPGDIPVNQPGMPVEETGESLRLRQGGFDDFSVTDDSEAVRAAWVTPSSDSCLTLCHMVVLCQ